MIEKSLTPRRRNTKYYTEADKRKMFEMFKLGATVDEIADAFPNRTRTSVKNKMQHMGLTRSITL